MIDTTGWKYLYKLDYTGRHPVETNMLYTPLINDTGSILCLWYDETNEYQKYNKTLTKDLVDFFFNLELKNLRTFQQYSWAPKIIEEDILNKKIFIEFNKETINYPVVMPDRDLNIECPDWKEQIFNILKDIDNAGYYKMALYPHCFFIDPHGKLKTIDFYSCLPKDDCKIPRDKIEGLIGEQSNNRFDNSTVDGMVDFKIFIKITMLDHLSKTWIKENPFPEFYRRLFND